MQKKSLERKAVQAADRIGLVARKSRRAHPLENLGGYMTVDPRISIPAAGFRYDLTAEEVINFCRGG